MRVAFVFPGQGSQEVGMGRALAEVSSAARKVFDEADAALAGDPTLARPLSSLCFEGPLEELTLTTNTQPALLATSVACLAALRERLPGLTPAFAAGHSLGEYSALVAAGALPLGEALRLVRLRGHAMQDAVAPGVGAMAAVMNLDAQGIEESCAAARAELPGRVVSPANFNAPGQIVIAGHADAVARASALAGERKGRVIPLKVSAPFHCALMQPAAERLREALAKLTIGPLAFPVVANVDAKANEDPARVSELLVQQVAGTVRWQQGVQAIVAAGVETFVELGPGKVLAGLLRRIHKPAKVLNVGDPEGLEATVAALSA